MMLHFKIKFNIINTAIICLLLSSMFIGVFNVLNQDALISVLFVFGFLILSALSYYHFDKLGFNFLVIAIILISILNLLINSAFYSGEPLSFNYFKKILLFSSTILVFSLFSHRTFSFNNVYSLLFIPLFLNLFICFNYYILNDKQLFYYTNLECLGFENPNFAAMWVTHLFILSLLLLFTDYSRIIKGLSLITAICDIYLIYKTGSRASLFAIIMFGLFYIFLSKTKSQALKKNFILFVVLLPIIIIFIYFIVLAIPKITNNLSFLVSEGKPIESRSTIWKFAFSKIKGINLLFGNYYGISNGTGISQMHNIHLDILASYGMVPLLLFCIYLYKLLIPFVNAMNNVNYIALSGFLSIIFLGSFEAGMVSGCTGLNYFTAMLLLFANQELDSGD